jgi:hypothetical protein
MIPNADLLALHKRLESTAEQEERQRRRHEADRQTHAERLADLHQVGPYRGGPAGKVPGYACPPPKPPGVPLEVAVPNPTW